MKSAATLSFLLSAAGLAQAHYTFDRLVVNGQETRSWEYIRENTRREKYMPTKFINSFDGVTPLTEDFRCNLGAFSNAGKTKVYQVAPGDDIAMVLAYGARMEHPGPGQVYLSKAPGSVVEYEGDGDWFKIHEELVCGDTSNSRLQDTDWCTWGSDRLSFSIPEGTPPGEYLIRAEHVGLHGAHNGEAEFYYSCAQVEVTGDGNGSPSPLVQFPGAYSPEDPGIAFSIWSPNSQYTYNIGPDVWTGGPSGGSGGNTTTPTPEPPVDDTVEEEEEEEVVEDDEEVVDDDDEESAGATPTASPGEFFPQPSAVDDVSTTLATSTVAPAPTGDAETPVSDEEVEESEEVEDDEDDTAAEPPATTSEAPKPPRPTGRPGGKPPVAGKPTYPGPRGTKKILECVVVEDEE